MATSAGQDGLCGPFWTILDSRGLPRTWHGSEGSSDTYTAKPHEFTSSSERTVQNTVASYASSSNLAEAASIETEVAGPEHPVIIILPFDSTIELDRP
jgi:hypothetical protein